MDRMDRMCIRRDRGGSNSNKQFSNEGFPVHFWRFIRSPPIHVGSVSLFDLIK